jgi:uracil-DNA glycosylase
VLWVGAAPGNAGGLGRSDLGAHGTRIPFGGDIAGGNLDVLLGSIGLTRNDTFIVASYNQLPAKGGGEPTAAELSAPVGHYPDSVALLRDTIIATGPALIVALGNVALRTTATALTRAYDAPVGEPIPAPPPKLPSLKRLLAAGLTRGAVHDWPQELPLDAAFQSAWRAAWRSEPLLRVLPVLHPSAQNMSPFAGTHTLFHQRMVETRDAIVAAARDVLGIARPEPRPAWPDEGIYALPEWRGRIEERQRRYDELWRERGV